jgi:hypothetical protein
MITEQKFDSFKEKLQNLDKRELNVLKKHFLKGNSWKVAEYLRKKYFENFEWDEILSCVETFFENENLNEQVDDEREIARSEISRDEIDSTVEYAKKEFPGSEDGYLSDLLDDLEAMDAINSEDENFDEMCDALVEAFPGIKDDRENYLSRGSEKSDREDFHADEAVGFVNYNLNEAKGNKMRIKLSELKKLIREELMGSK